MKQYDFRNDIKYIRLCLDLSQTDFAIKVGLSRSNIARYEAGTINPREDAVEKIYNYAFSNGFDINQSKTMIYEDNKKDQIVLYHGAKGEIVGNVDTKHSTPPNDFGNGFYLGETLKQANMWVALNRKSSTYCFYFPKNNKLKSIEFDLDYKWMFAILYYRGELDGFDIPKELLNIVEEIEQADYLIAPIADNQMYDTLELFRNNLISDVACLHALNANNLGKQYVLKSEKACSLLTPIDRLFLCEKERDYYLALKTKASGEGKSKTTLTITKYRKEGKLFNEIFKAKR